MGCCQPCLSYIRGCHGISAEAPVHLRSPRGMLSYAQRKCSPRLGRVQLPPLKVEVRPPRFDLRSLFTWCLRGFTLKCLFSLVLLIPTLFSQAVTLAQLPHFTASNKPSFDVGLPNPTLSKRGVTPLPPQHLPIGSFFLSSILDSWRKLASRKCRDNPY